MTTCICSGRPGGSVYDYHVGQLFSAKSYRTSEWLWRVSVDIVDLAGHLPRRERLG